MPSGDEHTASRGPRGGRLARAASRAGRPPARARLRRWAHRPYDARGTSTPGARDRGSPSRLTLTHLRHLLLARHGETDWNVAGRWQGHTDVPLNATGRSQAVALAARLRGEGIAAVATSDLSRARHTAEIVAGALGLPVALVDPDLREQRFGRFEGLTPAECEARYPDDWARYAADPRGGPPGGESRAALLERVVRAIQGAAARLSAPALLVTHGGAIRVLLTALPQAPGAPAPRAPGRIPNGGVVRVSLAAGRPVAAAWIEA